MRSPVLNQLRLNPFRALGIPVDVALVAWPREPISLESVGVVFQSFCRAGHIRPQTIPAVLDEYVWLLNDTRPEVINGLRILAGRWDPCAHAIPPEWEDRLVASSPAFRVRALDALKTALAHSLPVYGFRDLCPLIACLTR